MPALSRGEQLVSKMGLEGLRPPMIQKTDNQHWQAHELRAFILRLQEFQQQHPEATLRTCSSSINDAFGVAIKLIDYFRDQGDILVNTIQNATAELVNNLKTIESSVDVLRDDQKEIQATINNVAATAATSSCTGTSTGPRAWAEKVAEALPAKPPTIRTLSSDTPAPTAFTIKMNHKEKMKGLKRDGPKATVEAVNTAIHEAAKQQAALRGIKVHVAKTLRSHDIKVFTSNPNDYELLKQHGEVWVKQLDPKARLGGNATNTRRAHRVT